MIKKIIKCVVKNDIYEVDVFDVENSKPTNTVIVEPCEYARFYSDYELPNGIVANIKGRYGKTGSVRKAVFTFNGVVIKEIVSRNFQSYADHLNMFHKMEQVELDAYILKVQNETKTALEEEIEELNLQKVALKEELETYLEIQQKRKEINQLVKKLDR
jgi:uncharacterized protein YdcH (DUF465 family)